MCEDDLLPSDAGLTRRQILAASLAGITLTATTHRGYADEPAIETVHQSIRRWATDAPLALQFTGTTAEECRQWQSNFAERLRGLLGPHQPPTEWTTTIEEVREFGDHRRESLLLAADGHASLPVHLLIPKAQSQEPRPGIIAIHGHGEFGYDPVAGRDDSPAVVAATSASNYDYGRQLVRRGFVVVCPCLTPFGRRLGSREVYGQQDPCGVTFVRMQLLGKVLIAENLRDCLWSYELLSRHEQVDGTRIGCVGLSYGGRMSMLTAALEPRIRVAVVSGALNVMQERVMGRYSCGAQVIPGLLQIGDVPEIGSLIAPRPCVWETGLHDGLIVSPWADTAWERVGRAYRACRVEGNLLRDRFDGGHRWNGEVAVPLLERVLH